MIANSVVGRLSEQNHSENIIAPEQLAGLILEQAVDAIIICDKQGAIMRVNQAARQFCSSNPLAASFDAMFPLQTAGSEPLVFDSILQGETRRNLEVTLEHNGEIFDFYLNSEPLLRENEILGCYISLYDITERRRTEIYRDMSRKILKIFIESGDLQHTINHVLTALKTHTGVDAVGIRLQTGDDYPYFTQQGFSEDFLFTENSLIGRNCEGGVCRDENGSLSLECTCGLVISGKTDPSNALFTQGGSFWTNDSFPILEIPAEQDPRFSPRNKCIHRGYASIALIPIKANDKIIGLIQLNDRRKGRFSLETVELMENIAEHIGMVLMRKQTEEQLENLARFLAEKPKPVLRVSEQGSLQFANPAAEKILTVLGAEKTGDPVNAEWLGHINRAITEAQPVVIGFQTESSIFDATLVPVADRGYVNLYWRDVTEQKLAEDALRSSQQLLEGVIDTISVRVFWKDKDLVFLGGNMAFALDAGFSESKECIGKDDFDMVWADQAELYQADDREVMASGKPKLLIEEPRTGRDGEIITLLTSKVPLRDSRGEICGIIGTYLDITSLKQSTEELRKSAATQRALLNAASESALLLDLKGRILDANQMAARRLGVEGKDIKGRCLYNLLPQEMAASTRTHVERVIQFGMERYEDTFAGKVYHISIFPIADGQDAVQKVAFFARDITKEKAVDKMKSEFVSIASHELRTPISNITEAVSQVIDGLYGETNADQQSVLGIAHRNCLRLGRLIQDLLDISRIESGKVRLHRTFVDVSAMIKKVCDSFMVEVSSKNLTLLSKVEGDIPMVFGDADRLEQVLINLIGNALKFTPSGGKITVSAGVEGGGVLCTVADTGIGIDPEMQGTVFEKFVTGAPSAHGGHSGTGLGLAIARQLIQLHGGDLWVESDLGAGSRFMFRLPDYQSEEALREHLDKRISALRSDPLRITLLGIRPSGLPEQDSQQIDIMPLLFMKLREVLSEKLAAGINVWYLGNSGELVIVLDGFGDHASKIRQAITEQHEAYRFMNKGVPIEFGLNLATAAYPGDAADAHQLRCVLSDRLGKALPIMNAPRKVLIVDDEPSVVSLVEKCLNRKPFQTLRAFTGAEALTLASHELPDVILLDMGLPDISGYEVITRLKSDTRTSHIPLLIVTAKEVDMAKVEMFQFNLPVLRKPFMRDDLLNHVYQLLNIEMVEVEFA